MNSMTVQEWLAIMGGIAAFITVTLVPAVIAIINAMKSGQNKQAAASAIQAEQQNRYLASRGAEPVTMQSPPMGTGDGRIDKAVANQLAAAPTSTSTVPVAPAVAQPAAAVLQRVDDTTADTNRIVRNELTGETPKPKRPSKPTG